MTTMHGWAVGVGFYSIPFEVGCWALAVLLLWRVSGRRGFALGLSAVILAGLLLSHHAYLPDLTILLFPLWTALKQSGRLSWAGLVLASPLTLTVIFGAPWTGLVLFAIWAELWLTTLPFSVQILRPQNA
jgi:hypothetical protein